MQKCLSGKLKYFNYIKTYGLHNTCILQLLSEEIKKQGAVPLTFSIMSCATRRAKQNQDQDQDQRECICSINHKSYSLEKAMTLLTEILELTAQPDGLYHVAVQYLKCITNRRLFKFVPIVKRLEYLKRECKDML
jgi:hypothetical protein